MVKLGSNLGPITPEWITKPRCKTQSRPKRTNHIGLVSLPWAQGCRDCEAHWALPCQGSILDLTTSFFLMQLKFLARLRETGKVITSRRDFGRSGPEVLLGEVETHP
jgi:hypothetical protein